MKKCTRAIEKDLKNVVEKYTSEFDPLDMGYMFAVFAAKFMIITAPKEKSYNEVVGIIKDIFNDSVDDEMKILRGNEDK